MAGPRGWPASWRAAGVDRSHCSGQAATRPRRPHRGALRTQVPGAAGARARGATGWRRRPRPAARPHPQAVAPTRRARDGTHLATMGRVLRKMSGLQPLVRSGRPTGVSSADRSQQPFSPGAVRKPWFLREPDHARAPPTHAPPQRTARPSGRRPGRPPTAGLGADVVRTPSTLPVRIGRPATILPDAVPAMRNPSSGSFISSHRPLVGRGRRGTFTYLLSR